VTFSGFRIRSIHFLSFIILLRPSHSFLISTVFDDEKRIGNGGKINDEAQVGNAERMDKPQNLVLRGLTKFENCGSSGHLSIIVGGRRLRSSPLRLVAMFVFAVAVSSMTSVGTTRQIPFLLRDQIQTGQDDSCGVYSKHKAVLQI
jgi:hypothetical protein